MAGAALILVWWLFFSRAPWSERIGVLFVIAAAVIAIKPLVHASISNGFMGMMFYVYAVPSTVAPALVAWALFSRRLSKPARWATMIATMFLACACVDAAADQRDHRRCMGATGLALDPDRRRAAARAGRGRSRARRSCGAAERPGRCRQGAGCCPTVRSAGDGSGRAHRNNRSEERGACGQHRSSHHGHTRHCGCRGAGDGAGRVARVPRIGPRRHRSRREARDRLVRDAAGEDVASTDRPRLVLVRGPGRPAVHAGATRRRRDGRRLSRQHRRAGVAASRRGPVLGVQRRRRPARHTDAARRPCLHARRDRNPQRARRAETAPSSGRAMPRPTRRSRSRCGASRARR